MHPFIAFVSVILAAFSTIALPIAVDGQTPLTSIASSSSTEASNRWLHIFGEKDGAIPLSCSCNGDDICCETTKGAICGYGVCHKTRS